MPETVNRSHTETSHDIITPTAELLLNIVRKVVDQPECVSLTTVTKGVATLFLIAVPVQDCAKVVGLHGRTLQSLRTILSAISKRTGHRFQVDVESQTDRPL